MSVKNENAAGGESVVLERPAAGGVYASLFKKINLKPVSELSALDIWQDAQAMSDATADERLTAGMQVFLECLTKAGSKVEKLDKNLIDHHIAELDYQISRQLDAVMHHEDFQAVESLWRGVKSLVDKTDFRQNVKVELLDMSKEDLRQDFEDCPEIIQSGLYKHTYIDEYDTPGGEPIAALISAYEFDASAQDVTLLRNISKVSAAAHMPFIGSAGPKFFLKDSMEEVAAIKDIGNYFDRAEYIKWKSFRETDDSRYIGLVMPRVLGRLPYGPDNQSGIDIIGPFQGGGGGCCYSVPARWTPGMTVRIDWESGVGYSMDFPGYEDRKKYLAWKKGIDAQKRQHSKTVPVPDYNGQDVCGITVHFLPCDDVKVTTSCWSPRNANYPIKEPIRMKEPKVCPR